MFLQRNAIDFELRGSKRKGLESATEYGKGDDPRREVIVYRPFRAIGAWSISTQGVGPDARRSAWPCLSTARPSAWAILVRSFRAFGNSLRICCPQGGGSRKETIRASAFASVNTRITMVRLPPLDGEGWGGVSPAHLEFINRPGNCVHDGREILVQLLVSEADDTQAVRGEPISALLVVLDGLAGPSVAGHRAR